MLKRNIFYFLTFNLMIFPYFEDVLCVDYNLTADLRYRLKTDTSEDIEKDAFSSLSEMRSRIGINLFTENVSGHFILQDSRMLGDLDNSSGVTGSTAKTFFHQTYFIYKNSISYKGSINIIPYIFQIRYRRNYFFYFFRSIS